MHTQAEFAVTPPRLSPTATTPATFRRYHHQHHIPHTQVASAATPPPLSPTAKTPAVSSPPTMQAASAVILPPLSLTATMLATFPFLTPQTALLITPAISHTIFISPTRVAFAAAQPIHTLSQIVTTQAISLLLQPLPTLPVVHIVPPPSIPPTREPIPSLAVFVDSVSTPLQIATIQVTYLHTDYHHLPTLPLKSTPEAFVALLAPSQTATTLEISHHLEVIATPEASVALLALPQTAITPVISHHPDPATVTPAASAVVVGFTTPSKTATMSDLCCQEQRAVSAAIVAPSPTATI